MCTGVNQRPAFFELEAVAVHDHGGDVEQRKWCVAHMPCTPNNSNIDSAPSLRVAFRIVHAGPIDIKKHFTANVLRRRVQGV